ncbi:MAG: winged helix-turn-helix domain-containing protein, partial [Anaerolineaceae bacterium]|nr:winged helix-turn-helix domain-containing protein [Anaerolineaceae bacterium]
LYKVVRPARPDPAVPPAPAVNLPATNNSLLPETRLETPSLAFYFLGSFRVFQDDQQVSDWSSQRSLSILKYLAANHDKPVGKDILMDQFWAEADSEVARRNLHQAIYALRQALKPGRPDFAYIKFENDCYLLNPELHIWLDFEAFEKHHQAARRMDDAGQMEAAIAEYSIAEEYYHGDFLEDDLYEDWPNSNRVFYRAMYLDLLDHLSGYCIEHNQYSPAILLCKKILAKDNCAEQAYRALIQCYLAQGQRQLAVREYQNCVVNLKSELNLAPSPETQALYQRIFSPSR